MSWRKRSKSTAFQITRMGQMVATEASRRLDTPFGIVDLSLAPTPAIGDSVARILEEMGLAVCGTHGTTAALALLNDAVKKGGVMASGHVGGLSGAFIPVSEDEGMIAAARSGVLTIDKLEAMTCVCSVGLDMIAVPGDTTAETISAIIADEAAVGMVNSKTTAVRIIPVERQDRRRHGGVRRSARQRPAHASARCVLRGLHRPRRPHPRPAAEPEKLMSVVQKGCALLNEGISLRTAHFVCAAHKNTLSPRKVFLRRTRRRKKRISIDSRRCGGANQLKLLITKKGLPGSGRAVPF